MVDVSRKNRIFRGVMAETIFFVSKHFGCFRENHSQLVFAKSLTLEAMEGCPSTFPENAARRSARQCQNLQSHHSSLGQ